MTTVLSNKIENLARGKLIEYWKIIKLILHHFTDSKIFHIKLVVNIFLSTPKKYIILIEHIQTASVM
jgi:hypothetical protein